MVRRWLTLAVVVLAGCSRASTVLIDDEPPPKIDTNFDRLPLVLAGIHKSAAVSLYEGLPSNFWEPALREQELKQQKTSKRYGYPFYDELLTLQGADADQLTALFSATDSFNSYSTLKVEGGGYNPDYCVEWKMGDAATHALISLECGEVKLYGSQRELHCDLSPEALQRVKQLLGQYRKNRPEAKSIQ